MKATHLMSWEAWMPKKTVTSAMEALPGVSTNSGSPSPVGARSWTGARLLVAFSRFAA